MVLSSKIRHWPRISFLSAENYFFSKTVVFTVIEKEIPLHLQNFPESILAPKIRINPVALGEIKVGYSLEST